MKYSSSKDIQKMVAALVREGWLYGRGKKHGHIRHPMSRQKFVVPNTPGDRRAFYNFRSDIKEFNR